MFKKALCFTISIAATLNNYAALDSISYQEPIITALAWRSDSHAVAVGLPDGSLHFAVYDASRETWSEFSQCVADSRICPDCKKHCGVTQLFWSSDTTININEDIAFDITKITLTHNKPRSPDICFRCDATKRLVSCIDTCIQIPLKLIASPNNTFLLDVEINFPDDADEKIILGVHETTAAQQRQLNA